MLAPADRARLPDDLRHGVSHDAGGHAGVLLQLFGLLIAGEQGFHSTWGKFVDLWHAGSLWATAARPPVQRFSTPRRYAIACLFHPPHVSSRPTAERASPGRRS